jgi:hypothetical protein
MRRQGIDGVSVEMSGYMNISCVPRRLSDPAILCRPIHLLFGLSRVRLTNLMECKHKSAEQMGPIRPKT